MSGAAQARDATRVTGEAVPWSVAALLSAAGLACAIGVAVRVGPIGATAGAVAKAPVENAVANAPVENAVAKAPVENAVAKVPVENAVAQAVAVPRPEAPVVVENAGVKGEGTSAAAEPAAVAGVVPVAVAPAGVSVAAGGCPAPVVARFALAGVEPRDLPPGALEGIATWMRAHPDARVIARGYCDARGTDAVNRTIGRRRARALAEALEALGVPASRVEIRSIGAHGLALPKNARAAANRRAEVHVVDAACGPAHPESEARAW